MSLLIFAAIVIIVVGLLCWAVTLLPIPAPFNAVAQCLLIVIAVVVIVNRAGLL